MIEDTNPHALKRASIEEVALAGEPSTDKAFRCLDDNRVYRVRWTRVTRPVVQDGKEVADHYQALRCQISDITDGQVNRFGSDNVVLLVDSTKTIQSDTFANETPEAWFRFETEAEIYNASQTFVKHDGLTSVLKGWGN